MVLAASAKDVSDPAYPSFRGSPNEQGSETACRVGLHPWSTMRFVDRPRSSLLERMPPRVRLVVCLPLLALMLACAWIDIGPSTNTSFQVALVSIGSLSIIVILASAFAFWKGVGFRFLPFWLYFAVTVALLVKAAFMSLEPILAVSMAAMALSIGMFVLFDMFNACNELRSNKEATNTLTP